MFDRNQIIAVLVFIAAFNAGMTCALSQTGRAFEANGKHGAEDQTKVLYQEVNSATSKAKDAERSSPRDSTGAAGTTPAIAKPETKHERVFDSPRTDQAKQASSKMPEHGFEETTFQDLMVMVRESDEAQSLIIDARKREDFLNGHIPRAIQSFPYEGDSDLAAIATRATKARKVVVYCYGGDCEDHILLADMLISIGVPKEKVFLYSDGWSEWCKQHGPAEANFQPAQHVIPPR